MRTGDPNAVADLDHELQEHLLTLGTPIEPRAVNVRGAPVVAAAVVRAPLVLNHCLVKAKHAKWQL